MGESPEPTPNVLDNLLHSTQQIIPTKSENTTIKRELEPEPTQSQSITEEPTLKKMKLERISESEFTPHITSQQFTSSPSPTPQTLTANSRTEVRDQINQLTETDLLSTSNMPILSNDSPSLPTEPLSNIAAVKKESKQTSPVAPTPSKSELVAQSGRKVEDIIDGSDLRKFLHRTLTSHMIKGLDELVKLWESGNFQTIENSNDTDLDRQVVLKFADILKELVEK